jgi:predicted nucleic acid-binding protein
VIRQGIYTGLISKDEGQVAVDDVFALGVEVILTDRGLGKSALDWADRLGQSKAYDGFYLALAERLKAEFWTADKRLANRASQLGSTWAHWIGEEIEDIS